MTPWREKSEAELVLAALVGSLEAFDELARRYRPAMFTVARSVVGSWEAAEDVVQDALLLAFKGLPQLKEVGRFGAWLSAITRHRAWKYARSNGRTEPHSDLEQLILTHTREFVVDAYELSAKSETRREIREALDSLEPEYRVALELAYWEGFSQQGIADFLELPLTTVKWRLHLGKQMLRERLLQLQGDVRWRRNSTRRRGNKSAN